MSKRKQDYSSPCRRKKCFSRFLGFFPFSAPTLTHTLLSCQATKGVNHPEAVYYSGEWLNDSMTWSFSTPMWPHSCTHSFIPLLDRLPSSGCFQQANTSPVPCAGLEGEHRVVCLRPPACLPGPLYASVTLCRRWNRHTHTHTPPWTRTQQHKCITTHFTAQSWVKLESWLAGQDWK